MNSPNIINKAEKDDSWEFAVGIENTTFTVTVDKYYWQKLTNEKITPEELVIRSFFFLLEREPRDSILTRFDLRDISTYFKEYEDTIKVS